MENQTVTFTEGKRPRNTLEMPTVHFVEYDDWIHKLGEKPYIFWKRLYTWIDRKEDKENRKLTRSLQSVADEAEVSISTLRRWVKVLWEFGLIDLEEWSQSNRNSQKPVNIIVYVSPQNDHSLRVQPLVKCRDWAKDYHSQAKVAGSKGGRPKVQQDKPSNEVKKQMEVEEQDGFKNETVEIESDDRFKNETVDGFKNETVTVSKMKPNNKLITLTNNLNTSSNNLNTTTSKEKNISSSREQIDIKLQKTYPNAPFGTIKQGVLEDNSLIIKTAKQYESILTYRLKHWKPTRTEQTPKWMNKQKEDQGQVNVSSSKENKLSDEEFELEKKRLEEELKQLDQDLKSGKLQNT